MHACLTDHLRSLQKLQLRIGLIVAFHSYGHGIGITRIKILRHFHVFDIGIAPLLCIFIENRIQLHVFCRQCRCRMLDVSLCLLSIRKHHKPSCRIVRDHGKSCGNGFLKVGCIRLWCRENLKTVFLTGQKLFHNRIGSKRYDGILIVLWHVFDLPAHILLHLREICGIALRQINQKNGCIFRVGKRHRNSADSQHQKGKPHQTHRKIKPPTVTHLPDITDPLQYHKKKHKDKDDIAHLLSHKLPLHRVAASGIACRDPSIRLAAACKFYNIGFLSVARFYGKQSCLIGRCCNLLHVHTV